MGPRINFSGKPCHHKLRCQVQVRASIAPKTFTQQTPKTSDAIIGDVRQRTGVASFGIGLEKGPRDIMEDTVLVQPDAACGYFFAGVFDGHGGVAGAQFLSEHLYEYFVHALEKDPTEKEWILSYNNPSRAASNRKAVRRMQTVGGSKVSCPLHLEAALNDTFADCDRALLKHLDRMEEPECWSGSTATCALVRADKIVVANVGDSRAVIARKGIARGIALSAEHRPQARLEKGKKEIERINEAGGWVSSDRVCGVLAVSRAFGDAEFKTHGNDLIQALKENGSELAKKADENGGFVGVGPLVSTPDVYEIDRTPEDEFLIVASDGLWDGVQSGTAINTVRKEANRGASMHDIAVKLAEMGVKRRTMDNVVVVVIDLRRSES